MGVPGPVADPRHPSGALLPPPVVALGLLVGVTAVSTSAILIRVADAPPLAIAFWRCAGGAAALAPFAVRAHRATSARLTARQRAQLAAAGTFLALHFGLWIPSLELTTVASAVVLVTMAPVFVGIGAALFLDERPHRRTWLGLGLAVAGAAGIASADAGGLELGGRALLGDAMALGGAVMVAGYLLIGRVARRRLPVTVYATAVYGVAAVLLLGVCVVGGTALGGYPVGTWLAIAGLIVGPQLLGHTVFNALLSTLTATVVAVAILAEPVGATVLAWLLLDELPAGGFWLAAPLLLAGVYLAATGGRARAAADGERQGLHGR